MEREELLQIEIDKLIALAKEAGSISEDEVMSKLLHVKANEEDLQTVFNALHDQGINVVAQETENAE